MKYKALRWQSPRNEFNWVVVTDDDREIFIAKVPDYLRDPKGVAEAIALSLTSKKILLKDLI